MPLDQSVTEYGALRVLLTGDELRRLDELWDLTNATNEAEHSALTLVDAIQAEVVSGSERARLLIAWMIYSGDPIPLSHEDFLSQDAAHLERILRAFAVSCGWRIYGIQLFTGGGR